MTTTPDLASLEARFYRGDETVISEIFRLYSGPMYSAAYSMLGNRDMAADAVQRAFVQAWQAASTYDPARSLKPWLYAITRRAAIDVYRRERRHTDHLSLNVFGYHETDSTADNKPTRELDVDMVWKTWQVREALDQLHPDERNVLQLAYYDGYSQSEIASLLNIALGTVKSRTARAQRNLAALLTHLKDSE
ncbi:RNA polymerase sigma factor [Kribbella sp. CA-294648]|uniref:RNA polymerase sigma factor n=1 Tax=Kribbella sp. CA-294648 TaxID=3239948 RepID=UPI003D89B1A2